MATVSAYWRPAAIEEALAILARPAAMVIGGGLSIHASTPSSPMEVIDLQDLSLDRLERIDPERLLIGATTTLQQVADSPLVPECLREAARRGLPSTLRCQATVAGCVVMRDPESELQAALLVHDAEAVLAGRSGPERVRLQTLLADPSLVAGRIVTAVTIDTKGMSAWARAGRTPADRAIVAAFGRRSPNGVLRLALTGVAATPVLVERDRIDELDPPGDFRGSAEYRRALAATLAARVLGEIS